LWQEAQNDLRERVIDGVVKLERKKAEKRHGDNEEKEGNMKEKESNMKERQESESKSKADSDDFKKINVDNKLNTSRLELIVLTELSLKRLREWVEEDEDKLIEYKKDKDKEKKEEAAKMHQQFVRKKVCLYIYIHVCICIYLYINK
jgi:hypothetical protein